MKLKFRSILLTSILAIAGIFGVSSVLVNKQIEEAPVVEKAKAGASKTIYLDLNGISSLDECYLYMNGVNTWPGVNIQNVSNYGTVTAIYSSRATTKTFYKFDIDTSASEILLTHSSSEGYHNNKWNITSAKNTAWNLVQYTGWAPWGSEEGSYKAHHMHKIIIIEDGNTSYEYTPAEWGSYYLPTHSISTATFDGWYKDGTGTKLNDGGKYDTSNTDINDLTFKAKYQAGRYARGKFGSSNWGLDGAIEMPNTGTQYEGSITLSFLDEFKISYYDGFAFSSDYGYTDMRTDCGAYHYFTNSVEDNLICYAKGTYSLSFSDTGWSGKKISIEVSGSLNAQHLAAQLIALGENEGHCGDNDRFPAMRTIYLGLSSSEKTTFQGYASSGTDQFKNAYDRYTAWARALGEDPWSNSKAAAAIRDFSPFKLIADDETNITTIIIIAASSVALLSVTALSILVIKKRKQKEE